MKLFFLFHVFCLIFSTLQTHIRRPASKLDLPTTPKAQGLRNHYGVSPSREIYGPNFTISTNNLMARNNDGTWAALLNFNNDSIVMSNCDIKRHSFYKICAIATDCSICAAMDSCGWCSSTRECLPGNIDGCYCENACTPISFYNTELKCDHIESSGTISNIDPYATKLINAEIVGPTINITTTKISPEIDNLEVLAGERVDRKEILAYNAVENRIVSGEFNMKIPFFTKIPMSMVKIETQAKTYNASTGGEIKKNLNFGTFGK